MEAEERPAKLQKLTHDSSSSGVEILVDTIGANGESSTQGQGFQPDTTNGDMSNEGHASSTHASLIERESFAQAEPKMSKNQMKKLRRKQEWEAGREDRKVKRKELNKKRKERKREEHQRILDSGDTEAIANLAKKWQPQSPAQAPITVIFDCSFNDLMFEHELKSLCTQITRCYSDNRNAPFKTHLALSSFGGKLQERYDGILAKQYQSWTGFRFLSDDFVTVAEKAKRWMKAPDGGKPAGALLKDPSDDEGEGEVVYLSSESDVTLERLKSNSTYIIGGLVDHNRHKGICYKRAIDRGIKTAKLPIGEYLQMKSRQVLATNHVMEIMLKWLELGDWGEAFMQVMPKRKGGELRTDTDKARTTSNDGSAAGDNEGRQAEQTLQAIASVVDSA